MLKDFRRLNPGAVLLLSLFATSCADKADYAEYEYPVFCNDDGAPCCNDDGTCDEELGENAVSCPSDCGLDPAGPVCDADGTCEEGENALNCPEDCDEGPPPRTCGNDVCEIDETNASCPADCADAGCGDGTCGAGETQATCPFDCDASCGDGICNGDEDSGSCSDDCDAECGDGICNDGEDNASCAQDCAECGDGACTGDETRGSCAQDCCDVVYTEPMVTDVTYSFDWDDVDMMTPGTFANHIYLASIGNQTGDVLDEYLALRFYRASDDQSDGFQQLGTTDLAANEQEAWASCTHCVTGLQDLDGNGVASRYFFQVAGLIDVEDYPAETGGARITLRDTVLRETGSDSEALPDPNAACIYIANLEIGEAAPFCGDAVCSINEEGCGAVGEDCGCGNGTCDAADFDNGCASECDLNVACGNGRCEELAGEDKGNCPVDCCEVSGTQDMLDEFALIDDQGLGYVYGQSLPPGDVSGGTGDEFFQVEFYTNFDAVGNWNLASVENENYSNCEICTLFIEDYGTDGDGEPYASRTYFPTQGGIQVDTAVSNGVTDVTFLDTVLTETTIDWNMPLCDVDGNNCQGGNGTLVSTPVPDGRCVYLDNMRFVSP